MILWIYMTYVINETYTIFCLATLFIIVIIVCQYCVMLQRMGKMSDIITELNYWPKLLLAMPLSPSSVHLRSLQF